MYFPFSPVLVECFPTNIQYPCTMDRQTDKNPNSGNSTALPTKNVNYSYIYLRARDNCLKHNEPNLAEDYLIIAYPDTLFVSN